MIIINLWTRSSCLIFKDDEIVLQLQLDLKKKTENNYNIIHKINEFGIEMSIYTCKYIKSNWFLRNLSSYIAWVYVKIIHVILHYICSCCAFTYLSKNRSIIFLEVNSQACLLIYCFSFLQCTCYELMIVSIIIFNSSLYNYS